MGWLLLRSVVCVDIRRVRCTVYMYFSGSLRVVVYYNTMKGGLRYLLHILLFG